MTGRFGWVLPVAGLVLVAGCGSGSQPGGLPSAPGTTRPSATPSPSESLTPPVAVTTGTPEAQILAQVKAFFFDALPRAYAAPANRRRAILEPVTTEPALGLYLHSMSELDRKKQERRGAAKLLSQSIERSGATALVRMCADSTASGLFDKETGNQLTKGVPRGVILFTLKQTAGQPWKVSGSQPREQKC